MIGLTRSTSARGLSCILAILLAFMALEIELLAVANSAQASGVEDLLEDGHEAFNEGEYAAAAEKLRSALPLLEKDADRLDAHLHLGLSLIRLNRTDEAKAEFRQVLLLDPSFELDPDFYAPSTVAVFEDVRAGSLGSIRVQSEPPGAQVYIDDELRGGTPLVLDDLIEGTHRIDLRREGYSPHRAEVDIEHGKVLNYSAELIAAARAEPTPSDSVSPAQPEVRTAAAGGETERPTKKRWCKRWWFWTLVGVGAVGLLAAASNSSAEESQADLYLDIQHGLEWPRWDPARGVWVWEFRVGVGEAAGVGWTFAWGYFKQLRDDGTILWENEIDQATFTGLFGQTYLPGESELYSALIEITNPQERPPVTYFRVHLEGDDDNGNYLIVEDETELSVPSALGVPTEDARRLRVRNPFRADPSARTPVRLSR